MLYLRFCFIKSNPYWVVDKPYTTLLIVLSPVADDGKKENPIEIPHIPAGIFNKLVPVSIDCVVKNGIGPTVNERNFETIAYFTTDVSFVTMSPPFVSIYRYLPSSDAAIARGKPT